MIARERKERQKERDQSEEARERERESAHGELRVERSDGKVVCCVGRLISLLLRGEIPRFQMPIRI